MNRLGNYLIIIVFSSFSYLSVFLLRNYNSRENVEKRCLLKFQKEFQNASMASNKEWDLIMDKADLNYLKCMDIP